VAADLDRSGNQSAQVAFRIIEEMAARGEAMRVTDIARRLGMAKPRIHRFLQTLISLGYVTQDPETERYRLTLKLFHLGQAVADATPITTVARPVMLRLRDTLGLTTTLSVPEAEGMRVLDILRIDTPVQIVTRPGALLGFHSSAQGKLALAFGPPKFLDHVRCQPLEALTRQTNTDLAVLEREVAAVRARGWAVAPEETLPGVNAVSAPIFDATGALVASLTIVGSVQSLLPEPDPAAVEAVVVAARSISLSLGFTEHAP